MKITQNITLFQCDFCKKKYFRKHACERHEKFCPSNPVNFKACSGCIFLKEETIEYGNDNEYYGPKKSTGFKCIKKNQLVFPLKVERLNLQNRYPETFEDQIPMPKNCNLATYELDLL